MDDLELYTVYVAYSGNVEEEIDVHAENREAALEEAMLQLEEGYEPGWEIVEIVRRSRMPGTSFYMNV